MQAMPQAQVSISTAVFVTITAAVFFHLRPSHNFPCPPATKSRGFLYHFVWLVWCLFPPIGTCFFACKHFLLADTLGTKSRFYRFFLHQTQSKCDGNVRK